MVEFGYNDLQTIQANGAAILYDIVPCNRRPQRVIHDNLSTNITLRGIVNNCCADKAQYKVTYSGNIAVPEGGTAGEIQLALAVGGEILPLTISTATPAAAEQFWNVRDSAVINVPVGCCATVSVRNASISADPATTPAPAIVVRNLDVQIDRIA